MFSKIYLFDLGPSSFMAKRFKCRVKKINRVAGDFIHSYLTSFLACTSTSQYSKQSYFFICAYPIRIY